MDSLGWHIPMFYTLDKSPSSYTRSKTDIELEPAKKLQKLFFKHYILQSYLQFKPSYGAFEASRCSHKSGAFEGSRCSHKSGAFEGIYLFIYLSIYLVH